LLGSISSRFGSPVVYPPCGAKNADSQNGWKSSLVFWLNQRAVKDAKSAVARILF